MNTELQNLYTAITHMTFTTPEYNHTGCTLAKISYFHDIIMAIHWSEEARKTEEAEEERRRKKRRCMCIGQIALIVIFIVACVVVVIVTHCSDRAIRSELNMQSGFITDDMQRVVMKPRSEAYINSLMAKHKTLYMQEGSTEW